MQIILTFLIGIGFITVETGYTSYYGIDVMNATIEIRQEWGHIPQDLSQWVGFVARPDCKEIGNTIYLSPKGKNQFEPYLVVDCAVRDNSDGALEWMYKNNMLVEVDWATALKFGVVEPINYHVELDMVKLPSPKSTVSH